MRTGILWVGLVIILGAALGWSQAGPKLTSVDPTSGKAGDSLTLLGENLGKGSVESVLLSDTEKDYPAEMIEQMDDKIVMKVPDVKPGDYNVSVQIGNNIYIQPVRFKVEQ